MNFVLGGADTGEWLMRRATLQLTGKKSVVTKGLNFMGGTLNQSKDIDANSIKDKTRAKIYLKGRVYCWQLSKTNIPTWYIPTITNLKVLAVLVNEAARGEQ